LQIPDDPNILERASDQLSYVTLTQEQHQEIGCPTMIADRGILMNAKSSFFLLCAGATLFFQSAFAQSLDNFQIPQIAVEKDTGRADNYDIGFSGWVGSLRFIDTENLIIISEFSKILGEELSVVNGAYKITRKEKFANLMNFECIDVDTHIEWTGKLWNTDFGKLMIEMVQKQSPRKWVNLGPNGRKFLQDNELMLNLGSGMSLR
jgi:hypothetical protein